MVARPSFLAGSLAWGLFLASCSLQLRGPAAGNSTPVVRIIKQEQAGDLAVTASDLSLHFGEQSNGTRLVLDFLERARTKGATHVGGLHIYMLSRAEGRWQECRTDVVPVAKPEVEVVPVLRPGRTETRSVLKPVTRSVTEYEYRCRMVSHPVTRMETTYEYQYDYASGRSQSVPRTRSLTRYEYRNECRSEPVTRMVTRYEYQMESRYVPAQWQYISRHYSDWYLKETEPVCVPIGEQHASGGKSGRITGTIYVPMKR